MQQQLTILNIRSKSNHITAYKRKIEHLYYYFSTKCFSAYTIEKNTFVLALSIIAALLFLTSKGVSTVMNLLMVIFGLIAVCGVLGIFQSIREKNILAFLFNAGAAAIFGWFVIMTIIHQGYPPKLH